MIVCVWVPYFAAAIERRTNPSLKAKPLIIIEESRQVLAVSQEAAQAGIKPAMSLRQSQALCPPAAIISANLATYRDALGELLGALTDYADRAETEVSQLAAIIYLGLEPLAKRDQMELVQQIGQTVWHNIHLEAALGLASGKFPAYVASNTIGLNRTLFIVPGEERSFLAPMSVAYLPLDAELARRFRLLGLDTLGQFAKLPGGAVLTQFGSQGSYLHKLARGQDNRIISPYPPPPLESITRHLDGPVAERPIVERLSHFIAVELAKRLETQGKVARVLSLTLHLEDGTQWKVQRILRQPTNSIERLRLNLSLCLEQARISCGVEAMTISLADLIPVKGRQLELFANQMKVEHEPRLDALLPGLISRYGSRFYEVMLTNQLDRLPEQRFHLQERA